MENTPAKVPQTVVGFFQRDDVKNKFTEILGKRGNAYCSSVLTLVNQSDKLKACKPESVYMCALMAATLDLSINPSIGSAYIIPYNGVATFQIGYKGIIQLAQRSGVFKTIDAKPVFEGQIIQDDETFGGNKIQWSAKTSDKIIGYAGYFSLLNGFEKISYMSLADIEAHGRKFSKTYNSGPWKTDFEAMAMKTVLKLLLGKYAPLSVEMQMAQIADQSTIKNVDTLEVDYVDEGPEQITLEMIKEMYVEKAGKLDEKETENIGRIINSKEEASYRKVYNLLIKL